MDQVCRASGERLEHTYLRRLQDIAHWVLVCACVLHSAGERAASASYLGPFPSQPRIATIPCQHLLSSLTPTFLIRSPHVVLTNFIPQHIVVAASF